MCTHYSILFLVAFKIVLMFLELSGDWNGLANVFSIVLSSETAAKPEREKLLLHHTLQCLTFLSIKVSLFKHFGAIQFLLLLRYYAQDSSPVAGVI